MTSVCMWPKPQSCRKRWHPHLGPEKGPPGATAHDCGPLCAEDCMLPGTHSLCTAVTSWVPLPVPASLAGPRTDPDLIQGAHTEGRAGHSPCSRDCSPLREEHSVALLVTEA